MRNPVIVQTDRWGLHELLCSFFLCRRLSSELRGLMGTVGLGRVLELWLLGPDVVVEPGEKLADTRAAKKEKKRSERKQKVYCSFTARHGQEDRGERMNLKSQEERETMPVGDN